MRTQYLAFVQQLPPEFDEMRKQAAVKTAEWLKNHPENFDVCTGYMSLLLALRHPDLAALEAESIPYHQWIIAKNPEMVGYHFTFGEQLLRLEKFAEAKAEFEQVLARERRHQLAHRGLAIALQNLGESKKAEDSFKRALHWAKEKGGNVAMFHTSLGIFYLNQKRWPEAIKSFEEAGKESLEYYGNHWGIAKAQCELGKLAEAKQSLERALADPGLRSPAKDEIEKMLADISQRLTAPEG
ncbi:MAG: tetratricopeptide repeat protein [Verrucomicrobia bacterium]|nr:tetratricopeptide repeat protein [Verrucomicrobiota bacterium]